ncbi:MAG: MASE1 domain-containing protein [Terriglobia bacterium]
MRTTPQFLRQWQESPPGFSSAKYLLVSLLLFLAYYFTGSWGLDLAFFHPNATPVWAPTGIALSAFLFLGGRVWPAIFLGAFAVNLLVSGVVVSLAIAVGNTAEGLAGAYLVRRFGGGLRAFDHPEAIFRFVILAGLLSTTVSPTVGVTSLAIGGDAEWNDYWSIWLTWWLGDAVGNIVAAPLILLSVLGAHARWDRHRLTEAVAVGLYLFLAGMTAFGGFPYFQGLNYPLEFICIPLLLWTALRFGQIEAAGAVVILSAISIAGTLQGHGPFVRDDPNDSLALLQAFLGVVSVMTHMVAAMGWQRIQVEQELRRARDEMAAQATTDSLTGLANYRKFVDVFDRERERSDRTGRPFALVLFDLDNLKRINDTHGHLVGTAALRRVGTLLRVHCRVVDTAVRYGGDEFALVLPDTDWGGARRVANRVADRIKNDGEQPPISVSFGIALYPNDGRTIESVFQKSDVALYVMKNRRNA